MKLLLPLALLGSFGISGSGPQAQQGTSAGPSVSPQGILVQGTGSTHRSPQGSLTLRQVPAGGDLHALSFDLEILRRDGARSLITGVDANGFMATDLERVVTFTGHETSAIPVALTVLDLRGEPLHARSIPGFSDPVLASDGRHLAYRSFEGVVVLDLLTFEERLHENLGTFAPGPGGRLLGTRLDAPNEVVIRDRTGQRDVLLLPSRAVRLAFAPDGLAALLMTRDALHLHHPALPGLRLLYTAPEDVRLRDLRVERHAIHIGARTTSATDSVGWLLRLDGSGEALVSASGPQGVTVQHIDGPVALGSIPWPLAPNTQHPIGNTYAEFQDYGTSPYMHPGIDVMGEPGQPVYSVSDGEVKAILTTSGQYHWRVAIGDSTSAATQEGYLYAHLDLPTIAVDVGDTVTRGQYLGDLVGWPVANFTHTHFARIEDTGAQWFGAWLCTENPHLYLQNQTDAEAPVFENAVPGALFAFCNNNTSIYQNPNALSGAVDIIAHVGDRIESTWVCSVQELRYTIYPEGSPGTPIVNDKLAVNFDMAIDRYFNGPISPFLVDLLYKEDSTCNTNGDYSSREFFHILTNSNGDEVYNVDDVAQAWNTAALSDGNYVIEVTAVDPTGNRATASMTVTTANGNP